MRSKTRPLRPAALGGRIILSAAAVLLAGALAVVLLSGGAAYSQAEPAVSGAVGAPPVAANDTLSAVSGVPVDLEVLANDYDPDGAQLEISGIPTDPESGSAAISMNNTMITYTSNAGYAGTDSLEYEIRDAEGNTGTAHVMIKVGPAGPSVSVSSPADGSDLSIFDEVILEASAIGAGGNDISAGMRWSSDILGDLGTGNGAKAKLTYGTHNITASAADSDGSHASHSVTVRVSSERPDYAGTGIASASAEAGRLVSLGAADQNGIPDSSGLPAVFPDGHFTWGMEGLKPGSTARLSFAALEGYSGHSRYWAAANGTWLDASAALQRNGGEFALSVQDGGPYDMDGAADGAVSSTGGLGVLKEVPAFNPDLLYGSLRFSSFAPPDSGTIRYAQHGLTLTGSGNFAGVSGGHGTPFGVSGGASAKVEPGEWVLLSFDFPIERMRLGLNAVPPSMPDRLSQAGQYRFLVTSYDANGALLENRTVFYSVPYDPVQVSPGVSQFSHVRIEPVDALASLSDLSYDGFVPDRQAAFAAPHGAHALAGHSGLIAFGDGGPKLDVAALDASLSGAAGASGGSADAAVARDPAGGTVLVGVPGRGTGGAAFAFDARTGDLLEVLENPAPRDGDRFGFAVATDGYTHVVGAPGYDDPSGAGDSGAAYIFDENGTHAVPNPDPKGGDMFGSAVGITAKEITVHCQQCAGGGAPYALGRPDLGASLDAHAELRFKSASSGAAGAAEPIYAIYYPFEAPSAGEPIDLPWDSAAEPSGSLPSPGAGFVSVSAGAGGLAAASLAGASVITADYAIEFPGGFFDWGVAGLGKGAGAEVSVDLPGVPHENTTYWALANGTWANASSIAHLKSSSFTLHALDGGAYDADGGADGSVSVTGGFGTARPILPPVSITSPANGSEFSIFDGIRFEAATYGPDGRPTEDSVAWRSDILGHLGGGKGIDASLSYGAHNITAYARDAAGNVSAHSVSVYVSPKRPVYAGTGITSASVSAGKIASILPANGTGLPDSSVLPAGFPDGFFSWKVAGLDPGSYAELNFTALDGYPDRPRYWAAVNGSWLDASAVLRQEGGRLLLPVLDGGPYDADGATDGAVAVTGGLGIAERAVPDPSASISYQFLDLAGVTPSESGTVRSDAHGVNIVASGDLARVGGHGGGQIGLGVLGQNSTRIGPGEWLSLSFDYPIDGLRVGVYPAPAPGKSTNGAYSFAITSYDANRALIENKTVASPWHSYQLDTGVQQASFVRIDPLDSLVAASYLEYQSHVPPAEHRSIDEGLVARFSFDEGDLRNGAGADFGYSVSGAAFVNSSLAGLAASFDGIDDVISVLYDDRLGFGTGSYTVSMWASLPDAASAGPGFSPPPLQVMLTDTETRPPYLIASDGWLLGREMHYENSIKYHMSGDSNSRGSCLDPGPCRGHADGSYHRIGIIVDRHSSRAQAWYDGSLFYSHEGVAASPASPETSVGLHMGGQPDGDGVQHPMWGEIDEVLIYDRALSPSEMGGLYDSRRAQASGSSGADPYSGMVHFGDGYPSLDVPAMRSSVQPAAGEPALPARYTAGNLVVADGHADGGAILAGAPLHGEDSAGGGPYMPGVGAAFVFGADGEGLASLENPSMAPADWFGYAVATDGSTHVVGAPGHDDLHAGTGDSGIVYIFEGDSVYAVPNPDPAHGDMFGSAVGITGERITIYCPNCSTKGDAPYSLDRSDLQVSLREHIKAYHDSAAPAAANSESAVGAALVAPGPGSMMLLPWDMAGAPSKAAADSQNATGFTYVSAGSGAIASASLAEGTAAIANGSRIEFSGGAFEWGIAGLDAGASAALAAGLPDMLPENSAYWALANGAWANASHIVQTRGSSFTLGMLDGGAHDADGKADGQVSVTGGFGAVVTHVTNQTEVPSDFRYHVSVAATLEINSTTENGPYLDVFEVFGDSVAGIGDLDGDGTPDIAAGSYDENRFDSSGAVHIMFMNPNGSVRKTVEINSTTPNGPVLSDHSFFGHFVNGIGDLDGDGTTDIVATSYEKIYIMFMASDGSVRKTAEINPTTPNGPEFSKKSLWRSAARIGDLDGDGTTDIAAGKDGEVHVMFMNPDGSVRKTAEINPTTPNGPLIAYGDDFGYAIAGIGDLDGDGTPDIAAGSPHSDISGHDGGAVHIMFMAPDGSVRKTAEINPTTPNVPKIHPLHYFGISLSPMGDLNGDDISDIAVGSFFDGYEIERGAVCIMLMNQNGSVASTHTLSPLSRNVPTFGYLGGFGYSLSNIGDLNNDGISDIATGAPFHEQHNGAVYAVLLSNTPEPAQPRVKIASTLQGPHAQVDASDGYVYTLLHNTDYMSVVNASDITDPRIVGLYPHSGTAIHVDGDHAYIGGQGTLNMIDVSNKSSLVLAAEANTSIGYTKSIDVDGKYVYVGDRNGKVSILRITDPPGLDHVAVFANSAFAGEMYIDVSGDVLYAASRKGLTSIDVSNKSSPQIIDHAGIPNGYALHTVTVHDNYAYMSQSGRNSYVTIDVSDPSNISNKYPYTNPHRYSLTLYKHDTFQTAVLGNYAYVTSNQGSLMQFDISQRPDYPGIIYAIEKVHPEGIRLESISSDGTHLYIGTSKDLIILEPVNTNPDNALAASGASAEYSGAAKHRITPMDAPLPPFLQQRGPEGASGKPSAHGAFADLVPPALEYAVFDAESGILTVVFNEAMRSSSAAVDLSAVHIAESEGLNKTTLANASVIENDHSSKISIVLTEKQRDALLELAKPQLAVQPRAFVDAAGNALGAAASVQISSSL